MTMIETTLYEMVKRKDHYKIEINGLNLYISEAENVQIMFFEITINLF